jgi:hypothetical protein
MHSNILSISVHVVSTLALTPTPKTTWGSIKVSANGIGIGTLFNIAYEYGYVKDKRHLFTSVDNSVDKSVMVIHHSTGGTSKPSTMCNLLRASTKPLAATIIANAEPRGSAPMVVDNSLALGLGLVLCSI